MSSVSMGKRIIKTFDLAREYIDKGRGFYDNRTNDFDIEIIFDKAWIKNICASCGEQIIRWSIPEEAYYIQYGNYCDRQRPNYGTCRNPRIRDENAVEQWAEIIKKQIEK